MHSAERIKKITATARLKSSKISLEDVVAIKDLYASGKYSQTEIGKKYGISHTQVGKIVRGKAWKVGAGV